MNDTITTTPTSSPHIYYEHSYYSQSPTNYYTDNSLSSQLPFPTPPPSPFHQESAYSASSATNSFTFNYSSFLHCQKMTKALEKLRNIQRFEPYSDSKVRGGHSKAKAGKIPVAHSPPKSKRALRCSTDEGRGARIKAATLPAKSSSCEEISSPAAPADHCAFSLDDISRTIDSIGQEDTDELERAYDDEYDDELTFLIEKTLTVNEQEDQFMPYIC